MASMNPADPLQLSGGGVASTERRRAVGADRDRRGGWDVPRHKLDAAAVRSLLDAALLWPRGLSAVALTARGIQALAQQRRRPVMRRRLAGLLRVLRAWWRPDGDVTRYRGETKWE
jgi:hypothetical protein